MYLFWILVASVGVASGQQPPFRSLIGTPKYGRPYFLGTKNPADLGFPQTEGCIKREEADQSPSVSPLDTLSECRYNSYLPTLAIGHGVNPFIPNLVNQTKKLYGKIVELDCSVNNKSSLYKGMMIPNGYELIPSGTEKRDIIGQFCVRDESYAPGWVIYSVEKKFPGFMDAFHPLETPDDMWQKYGWHIFAYFKSEVFCLEATDGFTLSPQFQLDVEELPFAWNHTTYRNFLLKYGLGVQKRSCFGGEGMFNYAIRMTIHTCSRHAPVDDDFNPKDPQEFYELINHAMGRRLKNGNYKDTMDSTIPFRDREQPIRTFFSDVKKDPKIIKFEDIVPLYTLVKPLHPIQANHIKRATKIQVKRDLADKHNWYFNKVFGERTGGHPNKLKTAIPLIEKILDTVCPSDDLINWLAGVTGNQFI